MKTKGIFIDMVCRKSIIVVLILTHLVFAQVKMPPPIQISKEEPVKYVGELTTDKRFYDGALPHVNGAHHYQIFRANRTYPSEPGKYGWTYNHQPYIAYWNGKFYVQWLQGEIHEHVPPTRVLLSTSTDGRRWTSPVVLFPEYELPQIIDGRDTIPAGTKAVMHQRMGFYVAPNGKLLALGFYSFSANPKKAPNTGKGIGRVVREIRSNGIFGPIYFIRYNKHAGWDESNTNFPFYTRSKDKEFISACDSLLANKLITLQWWEEDRADDGFYTINPSMVYVDNKFVYSDQAGKAFCFYTRPDSVVVGLWKFGFASLSPDRGETWTKIVKCNTLLPTGAKIWGQRTKDGRYAIVYNHSATQRNRFPMAVLVGEDGHSFDKLYAIRGDVPPKRYAGFAKNPGLQYFRGIIEGNGDPPGNYMWIVYSVNKEDIWISRVTIPITGEEINEINEGFEDVTDISRLDRWNIYIPSWCDISIIRDEEQGRCLKLHDEEPYDYTYIEKIFPSSKRKKIEFKFKVLSIPNGSCFEVEIQNQKGERPVKMRIDSNWAWLDIGDVSVEPVRINKHRWNTVTLEIDCEKKIYHIVFNGVRNPNPIPLNDNPSVVERIIFRTGTYRNYVPYEVMEKGAPKTTGFETEDLPGSESKSKPVTILIDDIKTTNF